MKPEPDWWEDWMECYHWIDLLLLEYARSVAKSEGRSLKNVYREMWIEKRAKKKTNS